MPLPFSFSTQRQTPEVESLPEPTAIVVSERVMSYAPGMVITEPLPSIQGNAFSPPPLEIVPRANSNYSHPVPVRAPTQHFTDNQEVVLPTEFQITTLQPPPPSPAQPASKDASAGHDWSAQIEQLRNDIFGIAMNVSALNDRLDRMEQRLPQAGQSMQAGLATLRGEVEAWLESHLGAAVEHCMHQIISRKNSATSSPVN